MDFRDVSDSELQAKLAEVREKAESIRTKPPQSAEFWKYAAEETAIRNEIDLRKVRNKDTF